MTERLHLAERHSIAVDSMKHHFIAPLQKTTVPLSHSRLPLRLTLQTKLFQSVSRASLPFSTINSKRLETVSSFEQFALVVLLYQPARSDFELILS